MTLFDKFVAVEQLRTGLASVGSDPTEVVFEALISATEGVVNGRRTILAGTNNYLGLTFNKACIAAGVSALESLGTGTTGSRMANGSYAAHGVLEAELADFFNCPNSMVFSTGYAANRFRQPQRADGADPGVPGSSRSVPGGDGRLRR